MSNINDITEAIQKIISAKDAIINEIKALIVLANEFLEFRNIYTKNYFARRDHVIKKLSFENLSTPTLAEGLKSFILSDFAKPTSWEHICDYIENKFIPEMESIYKSYQESIAEAQTKLNTTIEVYKNAKHEYTELLKDNICYINELEQLNANQTSKKNEDLFVNKAFNYRPFVEKMDGYLDIYNVEVDGLYKAVDIFISEFEYIDKKRAMRYNVLLTELADKLTKSTHTQDELLSDLFMEYNAIDIKSDLQTLPAWNAPEEVSSLPEEMPEENLSFDINNFLSK